MDAAEWVIEYDDDDRSVNLAITESTALKTVIADFSADRCIELTAR